MKNNNNSGDSNPAKPQKQRSPKAIFWRNVLWYVLGSMAISLFIEQTLLFSLALILFISYRTVVKLGSWKGMFAPVLGSSLMQLLYFFSVRVEAADMGVFLVYQAVSLLGVAAVAGIGYLVVRNRRNKEEMEQKAEQEKKQFQERVKKMTAIFVLGAYLSMQLLAPVGVAAASVMSNGKTKQSVDEFFETYDTEKDYQPHTEPIVEYVGNSGPGAGGVAGEGARGASGSGSEEVVLAYYNQPAPPKNIFVSSVKGIGGWLTQLGGQLVKAAGKGVQYVAKNATNPGKIVQDITYVASNHNKWRLQGASDKVGGQLQGIWGVVSNPARAVQKYVTPVVEVAKTYVLDSVVYAIQNPLQAVQAVVSAPVAGMASFLAGSVNYSVSKNYQGGWQGLNNDVATALENPETYWSVMKSPFTESTVELFEQGEYAEALSRAEGELGVEAAELAFGEAALAKLPGVAGRVMGAASKITNKVEVVEPNDFVIYALKENQQVRVTAEKLEMLELKNEKVHIIETHTGKDDLFLYERLQNRPGLKGGVSTFTDTETAARAVENTINKNVSEINDWMEKAPIGQTKAFKYTDEQVMGRYLKSSNSIPVDAKEVSIVLKKVDENSYVPYTGFVNP